jgi:hypothetical protein
MKASGHDGLLWCGCRCKKLISGSWSVNHYPTNNIGYNFFDCSAAKPDLRQPIGNNTPSCGRKRAHRSGGTMPRPGFHLAPAKSSLYRLRYVLTQTPRRTFGFFRIAGIGRRPTVNRFSNQYKMVATNMKQR